MIQDPKNKEHVDKLTRQLMEDMKAGKLKLPPKQTERKVSTIFKCVIKTEWMRQFDWRERLRILFGANLVVMIGQACQHNPGVFQPLILGKVTNELSPDDHMRHVCENMLEERDKTTASPVVHEPKPT